jgi:acyl-CoA reductase-like NAD-dependent aldehyde dehydrogenase
MQQLKRRQRKNFKTPSTKLILTCTDPYGVALIIGAWNYPLHLTLGPLAGAIAAGNCAVIKPSEISPHTAKAIEQLLTKYLDPDCFQVKDGNM